MKKIEMQAPMPPPHFVGYIKRYLNEIIHDGEEIGLQQLLIKPGLLIYSNLLFRLAMCILYWF